MAADRYAPVDPAVDPDVVVVHGAMDRAAGFRRTIRHLPHRAVVAVDRRGYGGSVGLAPAGDLRSGAADLLAVLRDLHHGDGRRRLVVGHSMGGLLALALLAGLAADPSEVAEVAVGAVVYEPPLADRAWYRSPGDDLVDEEPGRAAESFLRGVLGEGLWARVPEAMRAQRRAEGPALIADLRASRQGGGAVDLTQVELPVIVGCGSASGERHRRSAAEAAAGLGQGPEVVVPDADHGIHLSQPAAFAALIDAWPSRP